MKFKNAKQIGFAEVEFGKNQIGIKIIISKEMGKESIRNFFNAIWKEVERRKNDLGSKSI